MVVSSKKPAVLHLELDDAWEFPIHKYTAAAFRNEIKMQKKFAELSK